MHAKIERDTRLRIETTIDLILRTRLIIITTWNGIRGCSQSTSERGLGFEHQHSLLALHEELRNLQASQTATHHDHIVFVHCGMG